MRVLQNNLGEEVIATIMRYVPVYDDEIRKWTTFDSFINNVTQGYESQPGSPIETDPIGAGLRIFFDPSISTIETMTGIRPSDNSLPGSAGKRGFGQGGVPVPPIVNPCGPLRDAG